jgi:transcriptional regulator with XRE-family HTH domain
MDKRLEVIVLQKGMTQKEIAEKVGVHQPKVSEWLRGVRIPNSKLLYKLAEVLEEEPDVLANKLKQISELE